MKQKMKKLFLYVCMVTIVLANLLPVFSVKKVQAVEINNPEEMTNTEKEVDTKPDETTNSPGDTQGTQEEKTLPEQNEPQQQQDSQEAPQTGEGEEDALPQTQTNEEVTEEDNQTNSALLITEISPDSKGSDYFEFFEVYNNTNQSLSLADYAFIYRYTDTKKDITFQVPQVSIESQETLVFWHNSNNLSLSEFNQHFGTNLTRNQVIEFKDVFPGFSNSGNRAAVLKDKQGNEIVSATYLPNETSNEGKVVQYQYANGQSAMKKLEVKADPTPGEIELEQVPSNPVELGAIPADQEHPSITHEPVLESDPGKAVTIQASISDDRAAVPQATLYYKKAHDEEYTSVSMIVSSDDWTSYQATISESNVQSTMKYYIEASDGTNKWKTEEYTLLVDEPEETYSDQKLLITEISPNSAGTDNYEFFELYNNTNQPLSLSNYSFVYHYTDGSYEDKEFSLPIKVIGPKETIVFWFNSQDLSLQDFNTHFGTNLVSEQVVEFKDTFPGFSNGGNRALLIRDHTGNEVVSASYLGDENDNTGKGIHYLFSTTSSVMEKYKTLADPTPGSLDKAQVPTKVVEVEEIPEDTEAPVITHEPVKNVDKLTPIQITASVTDNMVSQPEVTLYYKTEEENSFTASKMTTEDNKSFKAEIPSASVQAPITYYLEATDGKNRTSTEEYTVQVHLPEETYSDQQLIITEISPNSVGGGTDYYEYFELYNNTNQELSLSNYSFVYRYTDGSRPDVMFTIPTTTIKSKETLVFWYNNGDRTLDQFNENFSASLTSEQVVEFKDVFPGFANTGNRALVIKDHLNQEVVSASYSGDENDNLGAVIHYIFPASGTEMDKFKTLAAPTPGEIELVQVPSKPVEIVEMPEDTEAPVIDHSPVNKGDAYSPISFEVTVTDNMAVPFVTLHYKKKGAESFTAVTMNASSDAGSYVAEISGGEVEDDLVYYIEASDGKNISKTEEYTITVVKEEVDYSKVPTFLVTEIVPDSTNVGSADGYEFIEIYNNTDQDVNFKDFKLQYRYGTDPASDVVWPSVPDDVVIPAQKTLVFWIINGQNTEQTVADFNANYGTSLIEDKDIVRIYSDGMANASTRGLVVASNTKEEITVSYYNDVANVDDTTPNKGILYKYPVDGTTQSVKVSANEMDATPGKVEAYQVPKQPVHVEVDTVAPTIVNKTNVSEVKQTEDIEIAVEAKDDIEVKTVRLFYRTSSEEAFKETLLPLDSDTHLYKNMIYASDLIGKEKVEYFFTVSDGQNEVKSETYIITIQNSLNQEDLRLNVEEGEYVKGEKILKGTSNTDSATLTKLFVDGVEVKDATYSSLETEAYLAIEVTGLNTYFQNAVTMGEDILFLMDKDWLSHWKTFTIPIEADRLKLGENVLTVRAGNKASPFQIDEDEENRDDYNLRNVRLILADGTVLRDPAKSNPAQVFDMGDDGTFRPFEDFTFTITKDHTNAKTFAWDTTKVVDGKHTIKVQDSKTEKSVGINVDNTAPTIETPFEDGADFKGEFILDADVYDEGSGIQSVTVLLDDEQITLPYQTASSLLEAGAHQVRITAVDKVGNERIVVKEFSVNNENPDKPELISPADGSSTPVDGDPNLKVKVTDPTGDDLNVSYYKGYKYDATNTDQVKVFTNATDMEPPQTMVPEGEVPLSLDERGLVAKKDGSYYTTESSEQFPYHRFDVEVEPTIDDHDKIELSWSGKSLEGRKVSMYAWNHSTNKWTLITYKIAGKADFDLTGTISVKEYVKDSKINVIVQDEIPKTPDEYDYTFVWMSDTQYYSESYPYIFERQTSWIAEKQDELKIKYVFHTGDLVDNFDQEQEWKYADQYMGILDNNNVPYGVLAGNHDVDQLLNDYTEFYKYFGADRFENYSYYGGSYKNNRGHYDLISSNGNDFIMMYMGWGVEDEDLEWMNHILKQYPNRKAILNFHEYLLVSGNRSPLGNKIYSKVVEKNPNVIAVLSGHYHDSETLVSEVDDNGDGVADREVYQMLGDYQGGPEGGQGYLKLLHFDQDNNRILVNTYSPYLDDYNYYDPSEFPGKDEMVINLDLSVDEKAVATDYFAVSVKTDELIGQQEGVKSGSTAEVTWTGLTENETYSWFAQAEDSFTGKASSDIWTFTKGNDATTDPGEGTDQPGEGTDNPGEGTDQPGEGTDNPGEGTDQPGEGTDNPGEGTDQPGEGTDNPGEGTDQPGEGTDNPGEGTDQPGEGTDNPGEGTDQPGEGTDQPEEEPGEPSVNIAVEIKEGKATIHTEDLDVLEAGTKLILDLKSEYIIDLELSAKQVEIIKLKQLTLIIKNVDMSLTIPAANLPDGDVVVGIERMKDIDEALSAVYDFTIIANNKVYHQFKEDMVVAFTVTKKVGNPDKVKVYYYNEKSKKWETIGGSFENGVVIANTDHFSTFTSFEQASSELVEEIEVKSPESGYNLPDTATNMFSNILLGIGFFLIGAGMFVFMRRKNKPSESL